MAQGPEDQTSAASEPQDTLVEEIIPATKEEIEHAEGLIRQAQVAKMRGETAKASRLMEEAAKAAPNAPAVLEILGDAYMDKRAYANASAVYKRAHAIQPDNAGLERKYAEAVLAEKTGADPAALLGNDVGTYASGKSAVLISVLMPGVGHVIAGRVAPGIVFLSSFVLLTIAAIAFGGFAAFFSLFRPQSDANLGGLIWVAAPFLVWLWCQIDMASIARKMEPPKVDRPLPPVDKPF
jgi:tetratricopeptide (TPR) repeat protein